MSLAISVAASSLLIDQGSTAALAAEAQSLSNKLFDAQALSMHASPSATGDGSLTIYRPITVARASHQASSVNHQGSGELTHIVREGETLWRIAQHYGLTDAELAEFNDLSSDHVLQIGQVLSVPQESFSSNKALQRVENPDLLRVSTSSRNLAQLQVQDIAVSAVPTSENNRFDTFNIQVSGDGAEARERAVAQLRLRREQLRASLGGMRSEELTAPPSASEVESSTSSAEIVRALSSGSRESFSLSEPFVENTSDNSSYVWYEVQRGDTLATIARDHGTSLSSVVELNSISNPNRVFVGQKLRVPNGARAQVQHSQPESGRDELTGRQVQEVLVSALPQVQFGTTSDLPTFVSAPTVPPSVSAESDNASSSEVVEPVSVVDDSEDPLSTQSTHSSVSERGEGAGDDLERAQSTSETYVDALIQDIEEISRPEQSASSQALLNELDQVAQGRSESLGDLSASVLVEEPDQVNTEFKAQFVQRNAAATSDAGEERQTGGGSSDDSLIAVAPLGAENYSSPSQPAMGRIVSPDLPPLPGAENFIPSNEATFNGYLWPARGTLTSGYGWRWGRMHQGIDIAAPVGTPIYAAAPGVVEFSGWNSGGYGNMVDIRHPDGSKTRYAHNSRNLVRVGQRVAQGFQIAEMGSTGYSTGPHVHFEIHHSGRGAVNPIALLPRR
jgi:murein DD-endopeptidase MepM/ murein hydrolase activator NlpD